MVTYALCGFVAHFVLCLLLLKLDMFVICGRLAYLEISLSDVFATNNDFAPGPDFVMDGVVA